MSGGPRSGPVPSARRTAVDILASVLDRGVPLDDALDRQLAGLEPRERRFAHAIVLASLRHRGSIEHMIEKLLDRPLPRSGRIAHLALLTGAAQMLFVGNPVHAVVNEQVDLMPADSRFRGVVNAILRKIGRNGARMIARPDIARRDTPDWLAGRWADTYGAELQAAIGAIHGRDTAVPLDISVKSDPEGWAERLGGVVLPTGSVRLAEFGPVDALAGFAEGAWWVQDAAATLPVRLFGDLTGRKLLDACAAPGGKTAQALAAGARTTALDRSGKRLNILKSNLNRLGYHSEIVTSDLRTFETDGEFDCVLLDAPCSATGTIRRHPDIAWQKTQADVDALAIEQAELLDAAVRHVSPGGMLVYCTCSLEPEEGELQAGAFLDRHRAFERVPIRPEETGLGHDSVTAAGDLRTLPSMLADQGGMDGFFAARFRRKAA
ncbi:MAG: transcription antitermination factor NusB [Pseudomonadota bacterium]|nr:transcription antitermination factor NusB [Pseudomonadota bacterium]